MTKGVGIILMVIGHSGCPTFLHDYIYMFHMPLFFMMAGWCYKDSYKDAIITYTCKKIKGLYVPYVTTSLVFLILHNIFIKLYLESGTIYNLNTTLTISKSIIISMHKHEQLLGAMWFVPQLFYSSIIAVIAVKLVNNKLVTSLGLLALAIISLEFSIGVPYTGIGFVTFYAASFFMIGSLLSRCEQICNLKPIVVLTILGLVYVASKLYPSDIFVDKSVLVVPYFCSAILGTVAIVNICSLFDNTHKRVLLQIKEILCYIGENTWYILVYHFLAFKVVTLFVIKIKGLPMSDLTSFPVLVRSDMDYLWIIYTIIGISLPILICLIYHVIKKGFRKISQ